METPVIIVGGGPVGLAVAGDLGWRGLPSLLIERSDGAVRQPKMDMVLVRTMEFCRRWGIVNEIETSGYNRAHVQDNVWVTALAGGYELGREPFPNCIEEACPPQSPQKRERAPQNFFDPALARFVRRFPQAELRYQTEIVDFTQDDKGVTAIIRDLSSGETQEVRAQYLIGCDGAGSFVREKLGIGMTGNPVLTYTTNVVFRSRDLESVQDVPLAYRYIFVDDEGTWATLVAIDGRDHFRFSLVGGRDKRPLSDEELTAAVRRAVGRLRDRDRLHHAMDAARTRRRQLWLEPRVSGGRFRPSIVAHRRLRHEHRFAGIGGHRVEAGSLRARLGWAEPARQLQDRAQARRRAQCGGGRAQSGAHAGDAHGQAPGRDLHARPEWRRRAQGLWRLVHRAHEP